MVIKLKKETKKWEMNTTKQPKKKPLQLVCTLHANEQD